MIRFTLRRMLIVITLSCIILAGYFPCRYDSPVPPAPNPYGYHYVTAMRYGFLGGCTYFFDHAFWHVNIQPIHCLNLHIYLTLSIGPYA